MGVSPSGLAFLGPSHLSILSVGFDPVDPPGQIGRMRPQNPV